MPRVAGGWTALRRQVVAVGGQTEDAVGLVGGSRQHVVGGDEHPPLWLHVVHVDAQPVEPRTRNRCDFCDRTGRRIRPRTVRERRVHVDAAQRVAAAAVDVHRVQPDFLRQHLLDADYRFAQHRLGESGRQLEAARWQRDRAPAGRGDRVSRLDDRFNLLMRAVELYGLLVALSVEPVEEDARTPPQRRPAALERRPDEAAARTEVKPADLRLELLTDAAGDRQILAHPEVVLDVQAGLHRRDADERIADVAGERGWQPG